MLLKIIAPFRIFQCVQVFNLLNLLKCKHMKFPFLLSNGNYKQIIWWNVASDSGLTSKPVGRWHCHGTQALHDPSLLRYQQQPNQGKMQLSCHALPCCRADITHQNTVRSPARNIYQLWLTSLFKYLTNALCIPFPLWTKRSPACSDFS